MGGSVPNKEELSYQSANHKPIGKQKDGSVSLGVGGMSEDR